MPSSSTTYTGRPQGPGMDNANQANRPGDLPPPSASTPTTNQPAPPGPAPPERRKRGFAAMDPEKRREIARRGGKASGGRPENLPGVDRSEAGRTGGNKVVNQY